MCASRNSANALLADLLRLGDLDPPAPYEETWVPLALCLVLRDQAEIQMRGTIISEPITQASLARARVAWQGIRDLIKSADRAGRKRDYQRASEIYWELRNHPKFALNSVLMEDRPLSKKIVATFAHIGDWESCSSFLRMFTQDMPTNLTHYVTEILSIAQVPPDILQRAFESETMQEMEAGRRLINEISDKRNHWHHVMLGMKRYRQGRYPEALEPLRISMQPDRIHTELTGTLYAAMTAFQLGDHKQAREWFSRAEADFDRMLDYGEGQLSPQWHNESRLVELALKEARELMDENASKVHTMPQN